MKWILSILLITVLMAGTFCKSKPSTEKIHSPKKQNSFALLELFTSEGCSSCPSADRLLPVLAKEDSDIFVLSFHVDYWDNLGWKDAFSNAAFTERQRKYAAQFGLESIYTPQLVINGEHELVGSDKQKAESYIRQVQNEDPVTSIKINSVKKETKNLELDCRLDGELRNISLLAALVQKHAERKIGAGENRGATLIHTNVVRSFVEKPASAQMHFNIQMPPDLVDGEWQLILYAQRSSDLKITGATRYQ